MASGFDALSPRIVGAIGLLALAPVAAFGLTKSMYLAAVVTFVNVVLISICIFLLFSPHGSDDHGAEASH